ncbi:hypothetical protein [Aestuariivirga sp.]|uniref:hypothetical protein n=1 Tax=Aestuariivirga sp. TaxID=2650926 RepID=UPI0039E36FEA
MRLAFDPSARSRFDTVSYTPLDAPARLALITAKSSRTPGFDVMLTDPQDGDVLRWRRSSVADGVVTVEHKLTKSEIAAGVLVTGFGVIPNETYDFSVAHGRGGLFSAFSNIVHARISDAQAVLTPNSLKSVKSGVNAADSVTFSDIPLTLGKRTLIVACFYSNGAAPTRGNTSCMIDGVPASCIAWTGGGDTHVIALFLGSAATHGKGPVVLSYPGEQAFVVDCASYAVDNFDGTVSEIRSTGGGAADRRDNFTIPDKGCVLVVFLSTNGAPAWKWPGSAAGPGDDLIYIRHINNGNTAASYTVGNGGYGQATAFVLENG